ncbi:neutral zinc metallopeptidase [Sandaracinus amylolyticus]|uniref:KPN_02809 family neutral zinc metallopeptidase n=1 Tax=Sandaracinus amylolyticus TaxID=927083 RepID=UPI001F39C642|nr:neutral zinc metallopeptidase [Sandaracinus amylolyticus]
MRWQQGRRSTNVRDLRGSGGGGGAMRLPIPMRAGGGLVVLALLAISLFLGVDPSMLTGGGGASPSDAPAVAPPASDETAQFVSVVLGSTEDTWPALLARHGVAYPQPELVLFEGQVRSACGFQSAAVGPFYCPPDSRVYLDLSFFRELDRNFGAPGDFAQAYVIAHEVGHHVQNVLGTSSQVDARMRALPEEQANALSVRQELQADCYAGVWGHHAAQRGLLEPGDVEEGLRAAAAIGDDRLQARARGYAVPESFTHGTSEQRVRWFRQGLSAGDPAACDTFSASSL